MPKLLPTCLLCLVALSSLAAQSQSTTAVPGAIAELTFDGNSAVTYNDLTGTGNNAVLGINGANAPLNEPGQGVGFFDNGANLTAGTFEAAAIPTLASWQTAQLFLCSPILPQTTGPTVGGSQNNSFPSLLGASTSNTGIEWMTYNFGSGSATGVAGNGTAFSFSSFNAATGSVISAATGAWGGCHVFSFVAGTTGTSSPFDVDHFYVDGNEVGTGVGSGYFAQGASAGLIPVTGGAYYALMTGKLNGAFGARGMLGYAMFYPTPLSAAQVAQNAAAPTATAQAGATGYIWSQVLLRSALNSRISPTHSSLRGRQLLLVGDSLTAWYGATGTTFQAQLAPLLNNTKYNIVNLGLGGRLAVEICADFENRLLPNIVPGQTTILYSAATNDFVHGHSAADISSIWDACVATKAHKYNARILLATTITKSGDLPPNGQSPGLTFDSAVSTLNTTRRASWSQNFDGLFDLAEPVEFTGSTAPTNSSCYAADLTHEEWTSATTPDCASYGSQAAQSSYQINADIAAAVVNSKDGYNTVFAHRVQLNSNAPTYNMTSADNGLRLTANFSGGTVNLPECLGLATPYVVGNASRYSIATGTVNAETLTNSSSIASGATATFDPLPTAGTTTGCSWSRR